MKRLAFAVFSFSLVAAAHAAVPDRVLRPGMTVRDSVGKTPSLFTLEVPGDTAVRVSVRRTGVYLEVFLRKDSAQIAQSDDINGVDGEEAVVAPIQATNATYELELHPIVHTVCGSYELIVEGAPADDAARRLADAHRALNEARLLETNGDAKSFALSTQRFDEAIRGLNEGGDPLIEAEAIYRSAIVHGQMSHTAESIRRIEEVLPRFRALGFTGAEGRAFDRRGEYARRIGDIVVAEQYFSLALPLVRKAGDLEGESDVRNNTGLLLQQSGRWDEAIAMLEAASQIAERGTSLDVRAAIYGNIGQAYADMGDYARALTALNQSLELKRKMNLPGRTARTVLSIANCYAALGDAARAKPELDEALRLFEISGDPQGIGSALTARGRYQFRRNEMDAAAESYRQALESFRKANDRRSEGRSLTRLAEIDVGRGTLDLAAGRLATALAISRDTFDRVNEAGTLYLQAVLLQKSGRIDEAIVIARQAVDAVEAMREAIVSPELRSTYLGTVRKYFDLVIELLMSKHAQSPDGGFAAEAFKTNERSRARTLIESLAQSQADITKGVDPALLERQRSGLRELNARQSYRLQLLRGDRNRPEIVEVDRSIAALTAENRSLELEIRRRSPEYAELQFPEPIALASVQTDLLSADTMLIEYHLGTPHSYIWAISPDAVRVHVLPEEKRIDEIARAYLDLIRRNPAELETAAAAKLRQRVAQAGETLARSITRPLEKETRGMRLVIVPDGALYYVPFGALPDERSKPLISNHEVVYLQSATLLDTLRRSTRVSQPLTKVAVFADPVFQLRDPRFGGGAALPRALADEPRSEERWARNGTFHRLQFSRKEANAILAVANRKASLEALDFKASKEAFTRADLRQYGIIHIATHGVVNAEEPDLSGLVFSLYDRQRTRVDGFLRLRDIYNLDLDADLVVLSACRTALGKEVYGEGLIGLTRGFMYGGAKRVMATTWNVDDRATAELMSRLYDAMLRRGSSPARALREAQLAMWRDPRWSDPYYWAAFTLHGDWR